MKCPACGYTESKVIDSRPFEERDAIRRRRECLNCGKRFTTFETIETLPIIVIKKDGSKQLFERSKLLSGLLRATEKRNVDAEAIASEIENELQNELRQEVTSMEIGEMAMEKLREVDEVSYVRFASVYREFKDADSFLSEIGTLLREHSAKTGH